LAAASQNGFKICQLLLLENPKLLSVKDAEGRTPFDVCSTETKKTLFERYKDRINEETEELSISTKYDGQDPVVEDVDEQQESDDDEEGDDDGGWTRSPQEKAAINTTNNVSPLTLSDCYAVPQSKCTSPGYLPQKDTFTQQHRSLSNEKKQPQRRLSRLGTLMNKFREHED
jgi:hypothetical protein